MKHTKALVGLQKKQLKKAIEKKTVQKVRRRKPKSNSENEKEQDDIVSKSLPEYLDEGLDLIFIGDNPGMESHASQHHYAHATNQFWRLIYDSQIIPTPLTPQQDFTITAYGIGLTNVCSRPSKSSSELSTEEICAGFEVLKTKIEKYKPRYVCFNGKGIYEKIMKRKCTFGLQDIPISPGIGTFVVPSPSARARSYSYDDKLKYFTDVQKMIKHK
eukprot:TRINITY_DN14836_c0_g1_i2.p1 TRINITY_DN14836_c0_g1~~TRINITY_DN14836_c0_g1_i2.p1  ORF type:complete len:216 (-),score=48.56 TRINITY_DN14836_c0_g1_i2:6-653(-)